MDQAIADEWLWMLPLGAICWIAFLLLSNIATPENRATSWHLLKSHPLHYSGVLVATAGLIVFLTWVVTEGRASTEVLGIKSQWLALALACTAWLIPKKRGNQL